MNITVKTSDFQKMVAKAIKGAGNNKLLPITTMLLIEKSAETDNKLTLRTTDTNNTILVFGEAYTGPDFYCVVPVDIFSKLIARLTCDKITMDVVDDVLKVTGNGTYKISLPVDEDGSVEFPKYTFVCRDKHEIKHTTIKSIIAINKSALSDSAEDDCFCAYYVGEKVITSDENVICVNSIKVTDSPMLISRQMMDLIALSSEENIEFCEDNGFLLFDCGDIVVHGPKHAGIEEFPVEDIYSCLNTNFVSSCEVTKMALQSVIDRLSLFIEPYDRNGAYFIFTQDGIKIKSKKSSLEELVHYSKSNNFVPFVCCIDISLLKPQLDSIPTETLTISFGDKNAIKLSTGNIVYAIALFEDEELANNVTAE